MATAIALLPLIYFYQAVMGKVALVQGDGYTANLGLRVLTGRLLRQWILPLWDPYIFGGMPLLASIYSATLYPPNWLFAILPSGVAMNLVVITAYQLALIGAYCYGCCLGFGRTAALTTGLMFTFGGYMVMSMGQTSNITSAAWLPWVLLAVEKLYQRPSWRWIRLGAVFIALQFFAGVPQMTWYTVLTAGAYLVFSATARDRKGRSRSFLAGTAVMATCGALLSAIQLLPLRELQQQTWRAGLSYAEFAAYSFPPRQALALIFPYFFGGATMPPYRVAYWGEWGIFITCGYVGVMGLLLGLMGVVGSRRQPLVWFWAGIAAAALLLSFGDYLPFGFNHLLYRVPVYNLFRASFRHMLEFTFAVAVLAGFGVNRLGEGGPSTRRALQWVTAVMAVAVVGAVITYRFFVQHLATAATRPPGAGSLANPEVLIPVSFFALSVAALWCYARCRTRLRGAILVLILISDLVAYGHFLEWQTYAFSIAQHLADPSSVAGIKAREPDLNAFRLLSYSPQPDGPHYDMLDYPNLSIARRLQSANGYDMLQMRRPATVMGEMDPAGVVHDPDAFGPADQGFNLLNVKYLLFERHGMPGTIADAVASDTIAFGRPTLSPDRWRKLASFGAVDLYENLKMMPRAWFVKRLVVIPSVDALRTIKQGRLPDGQPFDPAEVALLDQEDFGGREILLPPAGLSAAAEVKVNHYEPLRVELAAQNAQAGFLVLSEIYYRGWDARVDGVKAPVYRANYTLRGVAVPPGSHRVEFAFRAPTFRQGSLYAGLGLVILLVGPVVNWAKGRRSR